MSVEVVPDGVMAYSTVDLGEHMFIWKHKCQSIIKWWQQRILRSCVSLYLLINSDRHYYLGIGKLFTSVNN